MGTSFYGKKVSAPAPRGGSGYDVAGRENPVRARFGRYAEVIDFYLKELYVAEGADKGAVRTRDGSIGWGGDGAAVCETIARHILCRAANACG